MVQTARPSADSGTDGNWLDQDDGSSLYAAIDEASADGATTHIYSTDNGGNDLCIVDLASISAPGSGSVYIKYTALSENNSTMGAPGVKFQLFEGTDARGAAHTNNSLGSSYPSSPESSSAIDVSSVSNWGNLKLRITMLTNSGSGFDILKVTQAYLETPDAGGSSVPIAAIAMNAYRQMGSN